MPKPESITEPLLTGHQNQASLILGSTRRRSASLNDRGHVSSRFLSRRQMHEIVGYCNGGVAQICAKATAITCVTDRFGGLPSVSTAALDGFQEKAHFLATLLGLCPMLRL